MLASLTRSLISVVDLSYAIWYYIGMDDGIIKIKCPLCDKEYGVSPNAFEQVDTVRIECYDNAILLVKMDKKTKTLTIRQEV
jgi:hypothetical protein